jgi:capsid assembly protease
VRSAILAIDSPGGSVQMIPAVAAAARRLAQAKPLVSVSEGTMASALYWIGSAANAVMISGETDMVGSIGVVATHNYQPRASGSVTTEITAGRFKRMASANAPLNDEGRAYLQAQVDQIYTAFLDAVALHRGVEAEQVHEQMADGRIWVGQQAIDHGLADGIATVDDMAEQLASNPQAFAARRKASFAVGARLDAFELQGDGAGAALAPVDGDDPLPPARDGEPVLPAASVPTACVSQAPQHSKDSDMTPQEAAAQFAADHPQAAQALRSEGAQAERDRVSDVRAQSMPGHEALIERLAADGQSTGADAAKAVLAAERESRVSFVQGHAADAPPAAPSSAAAATQGEGHPVSKSDQVAQAKKFAAEQGCDFLSALQRLGFAS